jgi:hypothetical protein
MKIGGIIVMAAFAITALALAGKYLGIGFANKMVGKIKSV